MSRKCIVPWTQMEICATGSIRPCAEYYSDLKNDDGTMLDFNDPTISINDIWNGHEYIKIRETFLNDQEPEGCKKCWQLEEQGIQSRRQREMQQFDGVFPNTVKANKPKLLDLKLGNLCNLQCKICNSEFSHNWYKDELRIWGMYNNKNPHTNWTQIDENWNDIKEISTDLNTLYLSGGEPFVIDRNYEIMEHLIKIDVAKNIRIKINTNGSIKLNNRILNLLKEFASVTILYSIDDIGKNYEYQRPPAHWEVLERNFKHALEQKFICVDIITTVSLLNCLSGSRIEEWCNSVGYPVERIFLNYLRSPTFYDISMLAQYQKDYIVSKLGNNYIDTEIKQYIKTQHEELTDTPASKVLGVTTHKEFDDLRLHMISSLEETSKLSLQDVNPEIADLVYDRIRANK